MAHPLDMLTADEITRAVEVLRATGRVGEGALFAHVVLREPAKDELARWKSGDPIDREVRVQIVPGPELTLVEAIVSVTRGEVREWREVAGSRPALLFTEALNAMLTTKEHPGYRAALAERGIIMHGIDISHRFVELARADAPPGATFERLDARAMQFDAEFDGVVCLCQGAFGLMTADGHDADVLAGMARALKPGGRLALTAFSSYFVVKHWEGAEFDAATGVNHERTEIRNEAGEAVMTDLWTGCYTPRELRLLSEANGLRVDSLSSVEPGAFTKVSALGVEEQRVRVIVELPEAVPALGDAFRVDAQFEVWHSPSVATVPVAALFRDGEHWAVYAIEAGRARLRRLDIGHLGDERAEVRGGLARGALVVLYPGDEIREGDRVAFDAP